MPKQTNTDVRGITPYQLFMLVLCLWAILILAFGTVWPLDSETRTILDYADNVVCAMFLIDFLWTLSESPRKWRYMASWGWIDLLSSIPTIDALRWGRAARLMRILR